MHGYLSAEIICSEKRTVFRERTCTCSSRKTVSFKEQIMSKDKYPCIVSSQMEIMSKDKYPGIFSPQMETIVFIILQIFFATHGVLKIGEYPWILEYPWIFPSLGWGIFRHVTRLDQSHASENIGWIIIIVNVCYTVHIFHLGLTDFQNFPGPAAFFQDFQSWIMPQQSSRTFGVFQTHTNPVSNQKYMYMTAR